MNQRVPNKSADLLKKISLMGTEHCTIFIRAHFMWGLGLGLS